jgi:predicted DNA-binding ribbon-helix-helix protein
MKSAVIKRSIVISGHKTSVSLEDAFWEALRELARVQGVTLSTLVGEIDRSRQHDNLSSAIRVFVFERLRAPVSNASANAEASIEHEDALPPLARSKAV